VKIKFSIIFFIIFLGFNLFIYAKTNILIKQTDSIILEKTNKDNIISTDKKEEKYIAPFQKLLNIRNEIIMNSIAINSKFNVKNDSHYFANTFLQNGTLTLWYRKPAKIWEEALPVGNGRLGAMVFGGVDVERLQINEDTLWSGGPYNPINPEARNALPYIRKLIFDGKYRDASKLIDEKVIAIPKKQMSYQPVGDLILNFPTPDGEVENYQRKLDLDTAVITTNYTINNVYYTREVFSSPVDQVIVMKLNADKPKHINFKITIDSPQQAIINIENDNELLMDGKNSEEHNVKGKLNFQMRARVIPQNGIISHDNKYIQVRDADSALIIVAVATSYKNFNDVSGNPSAITKQQLADAANKNFDELLSNHIREHQRLFRRVSIDIGSNHSIQLPTDERIKNFPDADDPQFVSLYFQYARYLLISSSRPGSQPANLQGIWNDKTNPPWGSKYTININTEMNYWPAEAANLSECVEPLILMIKDLSITGAKTAKEMYNARGWVVHHNTDLWRATAPIDGARWGMWPTGGAWLCIHLWDHYEFTQDENFLKRIYPIIKGAALFFIDTLVEDPKTHYLVTNPSISPENNHPFGTSVCAGPTMDNQILRDLFTNCITASNILKADDDFRKELEKKLSSLAPNQIGKNGQLQEWLEDWDLEAPEQTHRHISHLYGLFPSWQITPDETPNLAKAAIITLNTRGDMSTGWAIAWRINCWARLFDGNRALMIMKHLFSPTRTYPNMFDAHPPFQIDGNFGAASAIIEMLLQSRRIIKENVTSDCFLIHLLPALPTTWQDGSVKGLRARGGFEIDIKWEKGKLNNAVIHSLKGKPCLIRYNNTTINMHLPAGKSKVIDSDLLKK